MHSEPLRNHSEQRNFFPGAMVWEGVRGGAPAGPPGATECSRESAKADLTKIGKYISNLRFNILEDIFDLRVVQKLKRAKVLVLGEATQRARVHIEVWVAPVSLTLHIRAY